MRTETVVERYPELSCVPPYFLDKPRLFASLEIEPMYSLEMRDMSESKPKKSATCRGQMAHCEAKLSTDVRGRKVEPHSARDSRENEEAYWPSRRL